MSSSSADSDAMQRVLALAARDRAFRDALLRDPYAAISSRFGIRIPAAFRIKFIERDPDLDALVVLPDFGTHDDELSDHELDAVSGGIEGAGMTWSGDILPPRT